MRYLLFKTDAYERKGGINDLIYASNTTGDIDKYVESLLNNRKKNIVKLRKRYKAKINKYKLLVNNYNDDSYEYNLEYYKRLLEGYQNDYNKTFNHKEMFLHFDLQVLDLKKMNVYYVAEDKLITLMQLNNNQHIKLNQSFYTIFQLDEEASINVKSILK